MDSARTCWADSLDLDTDTVEALTLIAEEADRRERDLGADRVDFTSADVWIAWPTALEAAGHDDLADRVHALYAAHEAA